MPPIDGFLKINRNKKIFEIEWSCLVLSNIETMTEFSSLIGA